LHLKFRVIAQGESHKEQGLPCQDAAFLRTQPKSGYGIAIVADGHGSEKHFRSDTGSKIAVKVAYDAIEEFVKSCVKSYDNKKIDEQLSQLERTMIIRWRTAVLEHFADNPLSEVEKNICTKYAVDTNEENAQVCMYGSTLIAAFVRKTFWFVLQIGDGKCVVIDGGGDPYFPPELEDERLGGGMTTSLCDSGAAEHFRHDFGFDRILGVTVATDGVSDSFVPEEYLKLHRRLLADFTRDAKKAREGLQSSIALWSAKGSRDDVSMAGVFYKKGWLA